MNFFKRVLAFLFYFIALFVFFSRDLINLLNGTVIGFICGGVIFTTLTASLLFVNKRISVLALEKKNQLLLTDNAENVKLSSYENFLKTAKAFESFMNTKFSLKTMSGIAWPFNNVTKKEITDISISFKEKYNNIDSILKESFSSTDLTFIKYKETIDEVTDVFTKNLKGIQKRLMVFDYRNWTNNPNNENAQQYEAEITQMYKQNVDILQRFDKLIHELISLSDISDEPLKELTLLIEQTKNYKNDD